MAMVVFALVQSLPTQTSHSYIPRLYIVLDTHFDYAVNDSEDLVQVSSYASPRTVNHFGVDHFWDLPRSCTQMSVVQDQVVVTVLVPSNSTSGNVPEPWTAVKDGSNTFLYDSSLLRCRYCNPDGFPCARGKLQDSVGDSCFAARLRRGPSTCCFLRLPRQSRKT